jgi:hypothetical protein
LPLLTSLPGRVNLRPAFRSHPWPGLSLAIRPERPVKFPVHHRKPDFFIRAAVRDGFRVFDESKGLGLGDDLGRGESVDGNHAFPFGLAVILRSFVRSKIRLGISPGV